MILCIVEGYFHSTIKNSESDCTKQLKLLAACKGQGRKIQDFDLGEVADGSTSNNTQFEIQLDVVTIAN
jgi:hypothetical protein